MQVLISHKVRLLEITPVPYKKVESLGCGPSQNKEPAQSRVWVLHFGKHGQCKEPDEISSLTETHMRNVSPMASFCAGIPGKIGPIGHIL
jgi:hypothetical protein